jgi:hypothetical protein
MADRLNTAPSHGLTKWVPNLEAIVPRLSHPRYSNRGPEALTMDEYASGNNSLNTHLRVSRLIKSSREHHFSFLHD